MSISVNLHQVKKMYVAAAPDMLAALHAAEGAVEELCYGQDPANECWNTLRTIRAAIALAAAEVAA